VNINRSGVVGLVMLGSVAGAGGAYLASQGAVDPVPATAAATPPALGAASVSSPEAAPLPQSRVVARTPAASSPRRTSARARAPQNRPNEPTAATTDGAPVTQATPAVHANAGPSSGGEKLPVPTPELERVSQLPGIERALDFEELTIASDVVLGLQIDTSVSSEDARVEDVVTAHVTRDVRVGERIAVPAGAVAQGEVTSVERGGRLRDQARLGVRFTSLILANGSRVPMSTETIFREGESASKESAAKIGGGAIGGAILGGILGGGKGAVLGGSVGAGAGSAAVLAGGRNAAVLPAGAPVTVRLTSPVVVTLNR
jgi:hypothetical protein